jgi:hypothetical protein
MSKMPDPESLKEALCCAATSFGNEVHSHVCQHVTTIPMPKYLTYKKDVKVSILALIRPAESTTNANSIEQYPHY